jgi:Antitoxin of toxin-antitoxin stability system
MIKTNVTTFRKNTFNMLETTIKYNEPIMISTKEGNAVVLSEKDYNSIIETIHLLAIPKMEQIIIDGLQLPLSECIPENEVIW